MNEPIQTNAKYLLTDSRFVSNPEQSIFFAIKGERHDGQDFIEEEHPKIGKFHSIGVPLKFSETPASPSWVAPELGEDTEGILEWIGGGSKDP